MIHFGSFENNCQLSILLLDLSNNHRLQLFKRLFENYQLFYGNMKSPQNIPVISLENVSIRLPDRVTFEQCSWKLCSNEHWLITGPTGSGKSLFARALIGELPFVGGQVNYCFPDGSEFPDENITYVNFDDIRTMKTDDNLFVQSRYWSCDESMLVDEFLSEKQVKAINPFEVRKKRGDKGFNLYRKEIISLLKIESLLSSQIDHLSFGESRKVLLAQGLLKKPYVLILDNPLQGLDSQFKVYFKSILFPAFIKHGIQLIILAPDISDAPQFITHHLIIANCNISKSRPFKAITNAKADAIGTTILPENKKSYAVNSKNTVSEKKLIEIKDLSLSVGNKRLFSHLDWTICKGQHWALLGPNGSGKTTLLSLILGDHPQIYAHNITVFGKRWGNGTSIWDIKKKIGWVSPELQTCFVRTDSCLDVVCSGFFDTIGLFSRCSRAKRLLAIEWFEKTELLPFVNDSFGVVSEGVQRFILLLRAIIKKPELLILDEPLQGLDTKFQKRLLKIVDKIAATDCTVICVTHTPELLPKCIMHELRLGV